MALFTKALTDDQRKLTRALLVEGQLVAKHSPRSSFDSSDTVVSALTLRKPTWLRSSGLLPETRTQVVPFEGDSLFNVRNEEVLGEKM